MSRVHSITLLKPTATLRPSWNLSWEPLIFRTVLKAIIQCHVIMGQDTLVKVVKMLCKGDDTYRMDLQEMRASMNMSRHRVVRVASLPFMTRR